MRSIQYSSTVAGTDNAIFWIMLISIVLMIGIGIIMFYFIWRYDKERNPVPTQIHGNTWAELLWTGIPVFIVLGMFYVGYVGFVDNRTIPKGAMEIIVTAKKWGWTFEYPNGKLTTHTEGGLVLQMGQPTVLRLGSSDVIHGMFIPAYRIKEDCVPGMENYITFTPFREAETGELAFYCTEFCGDGHADMKGWVTVKNPTEFYNWYNEKSAEPKRKLDEALDPQSNNAKSLVEGDPEIPDTTWVEKGEKVYNAQCLSCHGSNGLGVAGAGARNFTQLDGWKNHAEGADPSEHTAASFGQMFRTLEYGIELMSSFQNLSYEERIAVTHYVRETFVKQGGDLPSMSDEEIAKLDEEFKITEGKIPDPEFRSLLTALDVVAKERAATAGELLDSAVLDELAADHPVGAKIYAANCLVCHGDSGQGGRRMATLNETYNSHAIVPPLQTSDSDWRTTTTQGFRNVMRASSVATGGIKPLYPRLSDEEWRAVQAYMKALEAASGPKVEGVVGLARREER